MNNDKILDELDLMQQIFSTLFSTANKIQAASDASLDLITSRQLLALLAIAHLPQEHTTLNNIAKKMSTTKQTASKLIASLKTKELVEAFHNSSDKRAINIRVTKKGQEVLIESTKRNVLFLGELFKEFSYDDLISCRNTLKKMHEFDGHFSGFEEDANSVIDPDMAEEAKKDFEKTIREFSKLRKE